MDVNSQPLLRLLLLRRLQRRRQERSQRTCWVRPILLRRDQTGEYHTLVREMRDTDPAAHQRYFLMTVGDFDQLLDLVSEKIKKETTNMRDPISPGERLAVTLRFLAAGGSMKAVAESYRIGYATIRKIIPEVCAAIWSELGPKVIIYTTNYIQSEVLSCTITFNKHFSILSLRVFRFLASYLRFFHFAFSLYRFISFVLSLFSLRVLRFIVLLASFFFASTARGAVSMYCYGTGSFSRPRKRKNEMIKRKTRAVEPGLYSLLLRWDSARPKESMG